jgi:hypothetical protein
MSRRLLMLWLVAMSLSIAWIVWPSQVERKEGALANVASIQGNVSIRPAGSFSWTSARVGSHLLPLDAIATGANSRAELLLENGATIVLPEDTQIKVQAQTVIPGMTISLIKGGLEVQAEGVIAEEVSDADKKNRKTGSAPTVAAAKPITIQTNRYSVDLSRLEGQFRLKADAGAQASRPETVRVQNAKGAVSLARLDESSSPNLDDQLDDSIADTNLVPALDIEAAPELTPSPTPTPAPKMKKVIPVKVPTPPVEAEPEPEAVMDLVDETPVPETLPLVEDPTEVLVLPQLKDTQLTFWSVETIEESHEIPLVLPLSGRKAEFNANRWQSILKISLPGTRKSTVVKREPGALGMFFYLRELHEILPQRNLEGLQLEVESGLMQRGEMEKDIRLHKAKALVTLRSLQNTQGVTLQVDGWRFVEPTDQWIRSPALIKADALLHLLEPLMLSELEGYLRGARAFVVQPLQAASSLAAIHFVRGKTIVASTDATDDKFIKSLIRKLRPDLVYRGSSKAFLGGKGSFDLNKETSRAGDLYYVRRSSLLKLDRNLFKTHSAARAFIRNFDPYFMSLPVDIIYNKD